MAEMIKNYEVIDRYGSGGMGTVYRALHPDLKKTVIIKELDIDDPELTLRFKQEAAIMMNLRHENIVPVFDFFRFEGKNYIVMDYINGSTLGEIIEKQGKIDPRVALLIFCEIANGLAYAETRDVVHRDLKPSNILISDKGEVRIIDFGIAAMRDEEDKDKTQIDLTRTDVIMGTPSYMSPEQLNSMKDVTHLSDIYSMGIILYEMLTGMRPFGDAVTTESITSRVDETYLPIEKIEHNLPALLKIIVKKCLRSRPARRYQSIALPLKKLQSSTGALSYPDKKAIIADYCFKKTFNPKISEIRPMYASFFSSLRKSRGRLALFTLGAGTLTAALLWLTLSGFYNRIFFRSHRGAVRIEFAVPIDLPRWKARIVWAPLPDPEGARELYNKRVTFIKKTLRTYIDTIVRDSIPGSTLEASLTKIGRGGGEREQILLTPKNYIVLESGGYRVKLPRNGKLPHYLIFSSPLLYRAAGLYSVAVRNNNRSFISFHKLQPLSRQKSAATVKLYHHKAKQEIVRIHFTFFDAETGMEIPDMKIYLLCAHYFEWTPWDTITDSEKLRDNVKNGRFYRFRYRHARYKGWTSPLFKVERGQTEFEITMKAVPVKVEK